MMCKLVIFGTALFAEVAYEYFTRDSEYEVVGFTVDSKYISESKKFDLPVVPFEEVEKVFPPEQVDMFVAIAYKRLNHLREEKFKLAKAKGYSMATFKSSGALIWEGVEIGEGCFILENNVIQPFVKIGCNTVLWSGNHIGHHSIIGNHCFIASHVVISGNAKIGDYTFIGVNATVGDGVHVAEENIIGAGTLILKNTAPKEVYAVKGTKPLKVSSDRFLR
ncbi:MAG: acetyltransferase [Thermotogae bacterium]|nr:acetyltransferase [Thermotogota bacterium]